MLTEPWRKGRRKVFTKVIASRWSGKILGVHIVGANAGEVIHEYVSGDADGNSIAEIEWYDPRVSDFFEQYVARGREMVLGRDVDSDLAEIGSVKLTSNRRCYDVQSR